MSLFATIQKRKCEANKKISYAQRSSIDSKKSKEQITYSSVGQLFIIEPNEVVESALFDKTVRDCNGSVMRKSKLRRFRKVGSDEWYSLPIEIGNNSWENQYIISDDEDVLRQGQENQNEAGDEEIDNNAKVENEPVVSTATSFQVTEGVRATKEKEESKKKDNKKTIIGTLIALGIVSYLGYIALKSKK